MKGRSYMIKKKETRRCVHKTSWKEWKVGQKKEVEGEDREQEEYGRMRWELPKAGDKNLLLLMGFSLILVK